MMSFSISSIVGTSTNALKSILRSCRRQQQHRLLELLQLLLVLGLELEPVCPWA